MSNHTTEMNKQQFEAELANLMANTAKIQTETMKLNKESRYYVLGLLLSSTVVGVLIALGSALLTLHFTQP
ncbi:MAG: hypothetical protein KGV56_05420 [Gammaproteobacteria bacterium]|nr:hypothetical protein [Gammaproteobacteria bacterium]